MLCIIYFYIYYNSDIINKLSFEKHFGKIQWYTEDRKLMLGLILDPKSDLHLQIAHGDGQTLLREALTLATHNSYHIGQLMTLKRILDA